MSDEATRDDARIVVVAEVHGRTALVAELTALLAGLAQASEAEPGCEAFRVLQSGEPGEFVLLESWSSEDALREHYETDHYRHYRQNVGPLLARASDVVVHHVSATVHALDPSPPDPGLLG